MPQNPFNIVVYFMIYLAETHLLNITFVSISEMLMIRRGNQVAVEQTRVRREIESRYLGPLPDQGFLIFSFS